MHKLCIVCGKTATSQVGGTDYCQEHIQDFIKAITIQQSPGIDVAEIVKSIISHEDDKLSK